MLKVMDDSKTTYKFDMLKNLKDMGPEQFAEVYWPSSKKELEYPWISDDGKGNLTLRSYPFEGACLDVLKEAESAYGDKKYDRAADLYKKALDFYQEAIDLNPFDFRGFFFKAHALVKLKRNGEAKESFIQSLTLKPRRKSLISALKVSADRLGISVEDEPFLPKSLARLEKDVVSIYSDPQDMPWFAHAVCKAFWLGEPEHRKQLTGKEDHQWSTSEELECLGAMLVGYLQARDDGKIQKDPALERIKAILDDGMMNQFIYYEIYARISPDVILLLPAGERDKLKSYVTKYVLVPPGGSGSGKSDAKDGV
jgi:tetratricopeptide (TPR) repeat protein